MLLRVTENFWLTPSCRGVLSAGATGQALAGAGLVSKGHSSHSLFQGFTQLSLEALFEAAELIHCVRPLTYRGIFLESAML